MAKAATQATTKATATTPKPAVKDDTPKLHVVGASFDDLCHDLEQIVEFINGREAGMGRAYWKLGETLRHLDLDAARMGTKKEDWYKERGVSPATASRARKIRTWLTLDEIGEMSQSEAKKLADKKEAESREAAGEATTPKKPTEKQLVKRAARIKHAIDELKAAVELFGEDKAFAIDGFANDMKTLVEYAREVEAAISKK